MFDSSVTLVVLSLVVACLTLLALVFGAVTLVLRALNTRRGRRWAAVELRWEAVLLEVLAGDTSPDALAPLVPTADAGFFVAFLLRFLQRLRGEERERVIELAQPYLGQIAKQLRAGSAEVRARAVQTLSLLGADRYRDALRRALDDPSPLVAMVGARALARGRDRGHAASILEHLDRFDTWSPRYLASMLAGMGPDTSAPMCDTLADPSRSAFVRAVAADALRTLNDLPAADVAAAVIGTTDDRELLAACLRLLATLGRPEHVTRIRPLLTSPDPVVRAMAVRALASLGSEEERDRLRSALEDPSPWVAIEAAEGLLESGGADILRAMAESDHPRSVLAQQVLRGAPA